MEVEMVRAYGFPFRHWHRRIPWGFHGRPCCCLFFTLLLLLVPFLAVAALLAHII
jgi:hypothetical protein